MTRRLTQAERAMLAALLWAPRQLGPGAEQLARRDLIKYRPDGRAEITNKGRERLARER